VLSSLQERIARIVAGLDEAKGFALVLSDERRPLRAGEVPPSPEGLGGTPLGDGDLASAMVQIQEQFESRWCDESVPALGGLTPREAAADPTRRESLERLLVHFEQMDLGRPAGAITMRPERLRQLLGLSDETR